MDPAANLRQQQHFAPHRRQQIEVQAALDHLPANQPRKNAQAAEEDAQANVIELDDARQDIGVVAHRE